jgi:hypothetical protein
MKRFILPVLLALLGLGAGAGAGYFLRPAPEPEANAAETAEGESAHQGASPDHGGAQDAATPREYVRLENQFIVPVVEGGKIAALVVVSLSLEIDQGSAEAVFNAEPKLRDAFLRVMFDHATAGGFGGAYTDAAAMAPLRTALHEAAREVMGSIVSDVLITEIVRQDT